MLGFKQINIKNKIKEMNNMNKKKLLVCALALSTVGVLSTIDTAGVLPFSAQTVQADDIVAVGNVAHKVNLSLVGYDNNRGVSVTFSTDSVNPNFVNNWNSKQDYIFVRTKLVNAKTKEVVDDDTGAQVSLRSYDLTKSSIDSYLYDSIPDGEYKYEAYVSEFYIDPQTKLRHQYKGESPIFSIKDGKFAGLVSSSNQNTSGKMDINAIKNGDFSSIEGRWSNGHGGEDLVFSKDGLIVPEKFKVDLAESEIVNEFLRARYSGPAFGVFIQFIPAGVRIPDETSMDGLVSDASDISKDRILYRASFPVHNKPEQFLYRVE